VHGWRGLDLPFRSEEASKRYFQGKRRLLCVCAGTMRFFADSQRFYVSPNAAERSQVLATCWAEQDCDGVINIPFPRRWVRAWDRQEDLTYLPPRLVLDVVCNLSLCGSVMCVRGSANAWCVHRR
jgi:hypothetical protein